MKQQKTDRRIFIRNTDALWNFRGDFGILDSGREDVPYTDWYGHKLDSKLLELIKKH